MALLRSRSLRLLLIAATIAVVAVPWLVEPRQVAVAWYDFEFLDTPATDDAAPHPGDVAPIALFRAFGAVGTAVALACVLALVRKPWRAGVDLVATLAIVGVAVGITLSAIKDGRAPTPLAAIAATAMLLALWSLAAPLLRDEGAGEEDEAEEEDEEDEEEDDEEDED